MLEQELRYKITKEKAQEIISKKNFSKPQKQTDTYYEGYFEGIFRIRESNSQYFCHKYFKGDSWEEWEVEVPLKTAMELKKALESQKTINIIKIRQKFYDNGIEINIDEIEGLGIFCEIEMVGKTKKDIRAIAKKMNLEGEIKEGYVQLMKREISS
ncbi:MAG: CYTH domain protein [Parcubacteria group bacterium ADurb.Bin247]|jgi:predicted adenylyl cyclase CyaB|nr:MAG: CYTH domain protein [Parcubacteria group bacterium ADurb.Bin247]HQB85147.1 CYTH domain-containing protein [Candidatus Pacearchaeota archaeon]